MTRADNFLRSQIALMPDGELFDRYDRFAEEAAVQFRDGEAETEITCEVVDLMRAELAHRLAKRADERRHWRDELFSHRQRNERLTTPDLKRVIVGIIHMRDLHRRWVLEGRDRDHLFRTEADQLERLRARLVAELRSRGEL